VELYTSADNPVPAQGVVSRVTTADGLVLRAARWRQSTRQTKGTVVILQGRAEFIEKYFETVMDLRRRGFHVATFDWRGQGGSQRLLADPRKGHVKRIGDYERDLEAFIAQVVEPYCPKPWFGLAHSMGGALAIAAMRDGTLPFERLVATAPMVELADKPSGNAILPLAGLLTLIGFGRAYLPGGGATASNTRPFADNPLTSDQARYERAANVLTNHPAFGLGDPTISWVRAAYKLMHRFQAPRYGLAPMKPILIIAAGADRVVSTPAIARFGARLKAASVITLPGAQHEILMENDTIRSLFFAAFDAFIPGSAMPEIGLDASERVQAEPRQG
jgi:lysophospholipase